MKTKTIITIALAFVAGAAIQGYFNIIPLPKLPHSLEDQPENQSE